MKKVNTKLSIRRITSNKEDNFIEITIEDSKSSTLLAISKISLEEFSLALTGLCNRPTTTKLFNSYETAGKNLETKHVVIGGMNTWTIKGAEELVAKKAIEDHFRGTKLSLDGWKISDYCLTSRQGGEFYQYIINRYVEE